MIAKVANTIFIRSNKFVTNDIDWSQTLTQYLNNRISYELELLFAQKNIN
jgi:hypothetical protein